MTHCGQAGPEEKFFPQVAVFFFAGFFLRAVMRGPPGTLESNVSL
jgi:hypothetical protein